MKIRYLILATPALLVLPQIGCSSTASPSGSGSTDCMKNPITPTCKTVALGDTTTPVVSFKTDIFGPIIRPTCNSAACHATTLAQRTADFPPAGLYLGPAASDNATQITDTLLSTINGELLLSSKTAPSMKIVAPGDPTQSFLMLKLTGCQNTKSLACTVQSPTLSETMSGCGDTMPPSCFAQSNSVALSDAQIATIGRWIAQGAKNN